MKALLSTFMLLAIFQQACALDSGLGDLTIEDLWDNPHKVSEISEGKTLLIYICKPEIIECREGAIYFDTNAYRIRQVGARPVCVFLGNPENVREVAVSLSLRIPIFVDRNAFFFNKISDERILPAMVAIDKDGKRIAIVYGGGEALATNLERILDKISQDHTWRLAAFIAVAAAAILLILTR